MPAILMETAPLFLDLGKPKPTTRQIADLVKVGGADALTEAIRRADAAKYRKSAADPRSTALRGCRLTGR